jgi:hypothetical protein
VRPSFARPRLAARFACGVGPAQLRRAETQRFLSG